MRRSCSAFTARRTAFDCVISVQLLGVISYFSQIRSSLKSLSLLRARSATNAAPTSLVNGTAMPRSVTEVSGLAVRVGGGGGLLGPTLKPGTPVYLPGFAMKRL